MVSQIIAFASGSIATFLLVGGGLCQSRSVLRKTRARLLRACAERDHAQEVLRETRQTLLDLHQRLDLATGAAPTPPSSAASTTTAGCTDPITPTPKVQPAVAFQGWQPRERMPASSSPIGLRSGVDPRPPIPIATKACERLGDGSVRVLTVPQGPRPRSTSGAPGGSHA